MIELLAALAFLLVALGCVMAVTWLIGTRRPARPSSFASARVKQFFAGGGRTRREKQMHQLLLLAAIAIGALTWILTRWPIGGIIVAIAIPGLPWLFSASTAEKKAIARLGALEAWTRRISDYVRNGIGLQAAIVATARTAPPLLEHEVKTLAARLQAGVDPSVALQAFADDLDDHSADQVVAPLIMQLADAGDGLYHALSDIAQSLSEEISTRSIADSERATARYTVRFLTGATIVVIVFGAINTTYSAPYRTIVGQLILVGLTGGYIALMLWIRALSLPEKLPRLLTPERVQ
jgi:Flp pilus assembly protein TadB